LHIALHTYRLICAILLVIYIDLVDNIYCMSIHVCVCYNISVRSSICPSCLSNCFQWVHIMG